MKQLINALAGTLISHSKNQLGNLVPMKKTIILLPILMILFSSCTAPYQVIYKDYESIDIKAGDRVKVNFKNYEIKNLKVIEVQPDRIVGKKVEIYYDEIKMLRVERLGVEANRYVKYFFLDSLKELDEKKVKVLTKDQSSLRFKIIQVEDSVIQGKNQTIGLPEVGTLSIVKLEQGKTTLLGLVTLLTVGFITIGILLPQ